MPRPWPRHTTGEAAKARDEDEDPYDFDPADDGEEWCEHCQNTGELDCHCGGDLCVCENNGTYPCPHCT